MVSSTDNESPITGICIVADKSRAPQGFTAIDKAYDEKDTEADVWKDSFFSLSRIYRYVCVCKTYPPNAFVKNVVADLMITNHGDAIPPTFIPLEFTEDTREKSLRKKQLCVRMVPRDTATDAICDLVILTRQKRPPANYTLAGEIDGLCICFKYGVIPKDFTEGASQSNPALPYNPSNGVQQYGYDPQQNRAAGLANQLEHSVNLQRQTSVKVYGIDGVPFQLHSKLRAGQNSAHDSLPPLPDASASRLDSEYNYHFRIEQTVLESALTM